MPQKIFEQYYKRLNKEQKLAVDSIDGSVMVVAGPGTGKTQILTLRIANILKQTDTDPSNILALTFTESGVYSMRKRLAEIIGSRAYSVVINTFHGFCNDIIKNYPEEFPRIIGSKHINEVDQIKLIEDLIQRLPLKELKPFGDPLFYVKSVLAGVNNLKREGILPQEFSEIVYQELKNFKALPDVYYQKGIYKGKMKGEYQKLKKKISKNKELGKLYESYQEALKEKRLYDYNDMIMEVLRVLSENKDLLLILQEEHQYLLVDEHQDTNNAQNKIMELLCSFHKNPNIFVVGDEKQAIFRFQGASLENFLYFQKLYPEARMITLSQNYRSIQNILDSAHSLLPGRLISQNSEQGRIHLYAFSRPEVENYFLARDINQRLKNGISPEEIAVLYRDNKDVFSIIQCLEKKGVPFVIESDQDVFADIDIKKLLILFKGVHNFGNDEYLAQVLHIDFLNIDPLDIYKMVHYAQENKILLYDVIRTKGILSKLKLSDKDNIHEFYKKLSSWVTLSKNNGLITFFEQIVQESGFLKYLLEKRNVSEKFDALNSFFNEAKSIIETHPDAQLSDFALYLETLKKHGMFIRKKRASAEKRKVRLMTVHKSKGLEFDYVYIVKAFDGHFGNKRRSNPLSLLPSVFSLSGGLLERENKNDDERRLFYVALTRARKGVTVTYSTENEAGRDQLPSQFISEIKPELIDKISVDKFEEEFQSHKEIVFTPTIQANQNIPTKDFIQDLFSKRGFSITALNNYLKCPWQYFYMNLLRMPRAPSKHQMYGTAIHNALRNLFRNLKDRDINKQFLLDSFGQCLNQEPLSTEDYKEALEKGKRVLGGYYDEYHCDWNGNVLTEFKINGVLITPEVRLTGVLDKIEFLDDAGTVRVVDYKTGKPKTRNFILGKTRASQGDYYRQLVFYKLLLNNYEDGKYRMKEGVIDFVEPDDKGRFRRECFEIREEEVKDLEEKINQVSDEILNLKFWDRCCDQKDCEYCALREVMQ